MSFESEIKKIQKLWDNSQQNQFNIETISLIQNQKEQIINNSNYRIEDFNKLIDLSPNWTDISVPIPFSGTKNYLSVQWKIVATLPQNWTPFARFQMAYRASDSTISPPFPNDPLVVSSTIYNYTLQLNDLNNGLTNAIWNIAFTVENANSVLLTPFQVKLYFILLNPNSFK